jgi:RNA polymerase sigma-70 factor (ECF subfamily)
MEVIQKVLATKERGSMSPAARKKKESELAVKIISQKMRDAREGDEEAFREWMNLTKGVVSALVFRMVGDLLSTEDVVQEVYSKAWKKISSLDNPESSLGWVCQIARNLAYDHLKHPSRREILILNQTDTKGIFALMDCIQDPEPDPEKQLVSTENCGRVQDAVMAMETKYRVVLLLRVADRMSYQEIATAMGIPLGTVETWLHRARAKLRKILGQTKA